MIESIATILNDRQNPLNTMEIDDEHQNLGRLWTPVCIFRHDWDKTP